ncbi:MAG: hypothetical protein ISN28_16165 [Ectothiorhodospiraceae bacterium AqS1]|nr:hypothetical protein [Ectothiorhodospiraceae bacterium AqS1]
MALKDGEGDGKDLEIKDLLSKVGELTMLIELRDEKIERLETGRPLVRFEVRAMSFVVWDFREKALRRGSSMQGLADEQHRVSPYERGIADIGGPAFWPSPEVGDRRPDARCAD